MRKTFYFLLLLSIFFKTYAQKYDLIVTTRGDSIVCNIDSITDAMIYFEMKNNNNWIHTNINKNELIEYKSDAIDRRLFIFREGTSYIESIRQEAASMQDFPRNSIYVGILTINYSRVFPREHISVALAGGLSYLGEFGVLGETTLLMGGKKHFFEPGIMAAFSSDIGVLMFRTGYRYQGSQGFLFRISPMFVIGLDEGDFFIVPAASIGYSF